MDVAAAEQPRPLRHRWRRVRKPQPLPRQSKEQQQLAIDDEQKDSIALSSRNIFAVEVDLDEMIDDTTGRGHVNGSEGQGGLEEKMEENAVLSERRKALFEPLEPNMNGKRPSAESLLPPPDFDAASYPKGWLIGKKRKLVNVDVVESMRRIAVQEMNRKDREIDGLNEQLEEDSKVLEHLQIQLLEEKSKRTSVERENAMLQDQINMLMDMLHENENMADDDGTEDP